MPSRGGVGVDNKIVTRDEFQDSTTLGGQPSALVSAKIHRIDAAGLDAWANGGSFATWGGMRPVTTRQGGLDFATNSVDDWRRTNPMSGIGRAGP
jgi:hypothetical protein